MVELSILVVDTILPNLSYKREQTMFCPTLHIETKVPLWISTDEAFMGLDTPMLAFQRLTSLVRLRHLSRCELVTAGRGK